MYLFSTELYKKTDSEIYLMYFHIGMSSFFGSSFIEFHSLSKVDTMIRCILLLLGKAYLIYLIGNCFLVQVITLFIKKMF